MNNNRKHTFSDYVISVIFIGWFVASILGILYCAKHDMGVLVVAIMGQYFLVFGIIAVVSGIKNKNFNPIILLFPIVGIVAIVGACIYQFGSETMMDMVEESIPYLILLLFFIVGVILVVIALNISVRKKNRCKDLVVATCVEVLERYNDKGEPVYCPVYEASYGMEKIRMCSHVFTSDSNVCVGDVQDLYINPDNPQESYDGTVHTKTALIVGGLGLFFMGISAYAFYMVFMG